MVRDDDGEIAELVRRLASTSYEEVWPEDQTGWHGPPVGKERQYVAVEAAKALADKPPRALVAVAGAFAQLPELGRSEACDLFEKAPYQAWAQLDARSRETIVGAVASSGRPELVARCRWIHSLRCAVEGGDPRALAALVFEGLRAVDWRLAAIAREHVGTLDPESKRMLSERLQAALAGPAEDESTLLTALEGCLPEATIGPTIRRRMLSSRARSCAVSKYPVDAWTSALTHYDRAELSVELVPLLGRQLQSSDDEELYWTLQRMRLYQLHEPAWLSRLVELVDPKPRRHHKNVRAGAVRLLGEYEKLSPEAIAALERILGEPADGFPAQELAELARGVLAKIRG